MPDTPHFKHPFTRGQNGKPQTVEQDSPEHVLSCVGMIVACPLGFRDDRPDFGVPWPEYRSRVDPLLLENAVRRLEPRASGLATDVSTALQVAAGEREINLEG